MYMYVTESGKISDCWLFLTGLKLYLLKMCLLKKWQSIHSTLYISICVFSSSLIKTSNHATLALQHDRYMHQGTSIHVVFATKDEWSVGKMKDYPKNYYVQNNNSSPLLRLSQFHVKFQYS